ncbi:acyl-CoA dehydrogenase family protein [Acrocarpospora macrocephala]|uniref:Acyl-CoA dehydrogenase n=1 Tax=Acrocarpospora macrocephala TaxID=150177 RepID=A0A5M3WH71_9ACTN|nr:acyl-CoA dehydrogenase family protein [Acrocarpospora macrocephala]GES08485.1 acyl-CoA dehydrogenase [Acrocarpospora macrocephala]
MSIAEQTTSLDIKADLVQRARDVAPIVIADADESERIGRVTPRVIEALRERGLFWITVPEQMGGFGLEWDTAVRVIEEVSAADGSTGWMLMANMGATGLCSWMFPASEKLVAEHGSMPLGCGTYAPLGKAVIVDGGLRLSSGPIPFNSGFDAAGQVLVMAVVHDEQGNVVTTTTGDPEMRCCMVDKDKVEKLGNWDVLGMAATGSYDIRVPEQFIASDRVRKFEEISAPEGAPYVGTELDFLSTAVSGHAPVVIGAMRRALAEIASASIGRRRLGYPETVDQHPLFGAEFTKHEAMYHAARDLYYKSLDDALNGVHERGGLTVAERARIRQAVTYLHDVAGEVVSFCALWGGTKTFRNPSVIGRCLRDVTVARNHAFVDPVTLANAAEPFIQEWAK